MGKPDAAGAAVLASGRPPGKPLKIKEHWSAALSDQLRLFGVQLVCSGGSSAIAKTVVAPLERIKILRQVQHMAAVEGVVRYSGIRDVLTRLPAREGGLLSLWRGNGANVARLFPDVAFRFAVHDQFRVMFAPMDGSPPGVAEKLMAGAATGVLKTVFFYPLDLCRTRITADQSVASTAAARAAAAAAAKKAAGAAAMGAAAAAVAAGGAAAAAGAGAGGAAAAAGGAVGIGAATVASEVAGPQWSASSAPSSASSAPSSSSTSPAPTASSGSAAGSGPRSSAAAAATASPSTTVAATPVTAAAAAGQSQAASTVSSSSSGSSGGSSSSSGGARPTGAGGGGAGRTYPTIRACALATLREEGVRGLYRGSLLSMGGVAPYLAISFTMYDELRRRLPSDRESASAWWYPLLKMGCGAAAAVSAQTVVYPLDTVRRCLQMNGAAGQAVRYASASDCFMQLLRSHGGVRALYRGCAANCLKTSLGAPVHFMMYDLIKAGVQVLDPTTGVSSPL